MTSIDGKSPAANTHLPAGPRDRPIRWVVAAILLAALGGISLHILAPLAERFCRECLGLDLGRGWQVVWLIAAGWGLGVFLGLGLTDGSDLGGFGAIVGAAAMVIVWLCCGESLAALLAAVARVFLGASFGLALVLAAFLEVEKGYREERRR